MNFQAKAENPSESLPIETEDINGDIRVNENIDKESKKVMTMMKLRILLNYVGNTRIRSLY